MQYIGVGDWTCPPDLNECSQCYGFSLYKILSFGKYKSPVVILPNASDAPGISLASKPGKLSTNLLLQAWIYTINRFVHQGDWTVANIKEYLKLLCVNEKIITGFVKKCRDHMNYEQYQTDPNDCDPEFCDHILLNSATSNQYSLPDTPPMWNVCPLDLCVETPMHLQMNFIHYNANFMFSWAKSNLIGAQLIRESIPHLVNAKKTNVSGFKVIPFRTEKFGGYVAENWRCLAVLSPWCFQFIGNESMIDPNNGPLPDPEETPFAQWRVGQLQKWFHIRNIVLEQSITKREMVTQAQQQHSQEILANIVVPSNYKSVCPSKICELHKYCKNYCNSLMSTRERSKIAEHRTIAYALIYLCVLDECYKLVHNCEESTEHTTTYTLLGILRAPTHFDKFVWVRSLYEGGDMGEGIIKTLRPLSPHGIRDGWAMNLIEHYYRRDVMNHLLCTCTNNNKLFTTNVENVINTKSFTRYGTKAVIADKIATSCALSVLFFRDAQTNCTIIGCMVAQLKIWYYCIINISMHVDCLVDVNGYTYFPISLSDMEYEIHDRDNKTVVGREINLWMTGIALPCYWRSDEQMYCFVTEDGHALNSSHSWTLIT